MIIKNALTFYIITKQDHPNNGYIHEYESEKEKKNGQQQQKTPKITKLCNIIIIIIINVSNHAKNANSVCFFSCLYFFLAVYGFNLPVISLSHARNIFQVQLN